MLIPEFSLTCSEYKELSANTKIFNSKTVEYFLWIQLPDTCTSDYALYEIHRVDVGSALEVLGSQSLIKRDGPHWLKIVSQLLDLTIGKHIYQLKFVNKITNDVVSYYFSYYIQEDNPDKDYVYMNREV